MHEIVFPITEGNRTLKLIRKRGREKAEQSQSILKVKNNVHDKNIWEREMRKLQREKEETLVNK